MDIFRITRRRLVAAAVGGLTLAAIVLPTPLNTALTPEAQAGIPRGACGTGYQLAVSVPSPSGQVLLFRRSDGHVCGVLRLHERQVGARSEGIRLRGPGGRVVADRGAYTSYAGPIYMHVALRDLRVDTWEQGSWREARFGVRVGG